MSRQLYDVNDEPIAGYRLVEVLGEGNFGIVWKAIDVKSGIYVALKVIDLSRSPSAFKELKALNVVRNLRHPNLIPIYTARIKDHEQNELPLDRADELRKRSGLSELVIAMGLGDRSLGARLRQFNPPGASPEQYTGLPLDEVLGYMHGAAKGIDYLNRADHGLPPGAGDGPIVHCDIKPDNLMVVAGEVQVADCGVAVLISSDVRQTKATCSLAYSPPELMGNKPMPGSDQYSLAITYYELRTGQIPIDRNLGQWEVMVIHAEGKIDFTHPALTPGESQVLKWATAVQPKLRYGSCWEMVKQLERASRGLKPHPPEGVGPGTTATASMRPDLSPPRAGFSATVPAVRGDEPPSEIPLHETSEVIAVVPPPPAGPARPAKSFTETAIPDADRILTAAGGVTSPSPLAAPIDLQATATPFFSNSVVLDPADRPAVTGPEIHLPMRNEALSIDEETAEHKPPSPPPAAPGRPSMLLDAADPLGGRFATVSLDPEIQAIIRGTPPQETPKVRETPRETPKVRETPPPAEPPTRPSPVNGPKPAATEEPSTLRSPAPLSGEQKKAKDRPFAMPKPAPAAKTPGRGLPAKLALGGLVVGTLAAGGFVVANFLNTPPAKVENPPSPPPPTDPPVVPVPDAFAAALKDLEAAPADRLAAAAAVLWPKATTPDQQKAVAQTLLAVGKRHADRQEAVTVALTADGRFADRVPAEADRQEVVGWHLAKQVDEPFAAAVAAVRKAGESPDAVAAADNTIAALRHGVDGLAARFGPAFVVPAKVGGFLAVADLWAKAHADPTGDLKPFADAIPNSPADGAFAVEFLRLGAKRLTPIATLRTFRDQTVQRATLSADEKQRVQDQYQAALAVHVRKSLIAADANADAILTDCGPDAAQGWAKLVRAEQLLAAKPADTTPVVALLDEAEKLPAADATAADKKAFLAYLRGVAAKDGAADLIAPLYEKPSSLLTTPARRKVAATILGLAGATAYRDEITPDEMLGEKANPYPRNDKALAWLKRAKALEETAHPEKSEWNIPLALLAAAAGDQKAARAVTAEVVIDADKVKDDELPFVIAFLQLQACDGDLPDARCVAAAAGYVKLADRVLAVTFQRCRTEEKATAVPAALYPKIDAVLAAVPLKADDKTADGLTLRLAKVRSGVFREPITADRQAALGKELDAIIQRMDGKHPDKADAHGYRAYVTHQRFSTYRLDGRVVGNLHAAPEGEREAAWQTISADVAQALSLDPNHRLGNLMAAYQAATEFGTLPPYAAPRKARKADFVANEPRVDRAAKAFKAAGDAVPFGKHATLWAGRAGFLVAAATDFATAGKQADPRVKEWLADAEKAVAKADELRPARRDDERRLHGWVLEAKAWIAQDDPAANFAKALQLLKPDRPPATDAEFEAAEIYARCAIRGVRTGALPQSHLADAEAALDQHLRAADALLADEKTPREAKAALDRHVLRGEYWRAIARVHRLDAELDAKNRPADETLTEATEAADLIESLVKKDPALKATAGYLPEYLRGRATLRRSNAGAAAEHFKKAYEALADQRDAGLRLDDSFAVKALVHELGPAGLQFLVGGDDQRKRRDLLTDLERRYGWLLTAKDRAAVKSVLKK